MKATDFGAVPDKHRRGWIGVFTCRHGDVQRTEMVRDDKGAVVLFRDEAMAKQEAGAAMCRAIDGVKRGPKKPRVMLVAKGGRRSARLVEQAQAVFRAKVRQP